MSKKVIADVDLTKKGTTGFAGTVQADVGSIAPALSSLARHVDMRRYHPSLDPQLTLFEVIRRTSERLNFNRYSEFMTEVFTGPENNKDADIIGRSRNSAGVTGLGGALFTGTRSYGLLKQATDVFVQSQCGVWPTDAFGLPYEPEKAPRGMFPVKTPERAFGDKESEPETPAADASRRLERDESEFPDYILEEFWERYVQTVEGGVSSSIPYIDLILHKFRGAQLVPDSAGETCDHFKCLGILEEKLNNPCLIELIWSYWMEQGMVVQSINALSQRFQNRRTADLDVLARFDVDPLRPLSNLLWGYIQDEQNRLTVARRAYEYDHHYGLRLQGRAVPPLQTADSRPKFLESFHLLLRECARFYKAITNTFINPDTYPALNALRELQIILTEGMHNQYGDLPSTSRSEMLSQQLLMSRPEMLQFVGQRTMVPHPEPWMGYVDTIRQIHGWGDTSVRHFRDLAICGERILLAVRFGNWSTQQSDIAAALFMSFFREEAQTYIHAYRSVTGVDLSVEDVRAHDPRLFIAQPAELLSRRLPGPARANGKARLTAQARSVPQLPQPTSPANPPR